MKENLKKLITARFIITMCFGTMIFGMILGLYLLKIPTDNLNLINIALGFVAGWESSAVAYYFGKAELERQKKELENQKGQSHD